MDEKGILVICSLIDARVKMCQSAMIHSNKYLEKHKYDNSDKSIANNILKTMPNIILEMVSLKE